MIQSSEPQVKHVLAKISVLLNRFHSDQINYCHWKSNEHLNASMTGDTDLDILFQQNQKTQLELIFAETGFKLFEAVRAKTYKDIVDYIGLDESSGKVIHVHTHYRLTLGKPFLKGYQLDLEDALLSTRVFDDEFSIYCADPSFELVLLYVRESLKVRNRDKISFFLGKRKGYNEFALREYQWLKEKSDPSMVRKIVRNVFQRAEEVNAIILNKDFSRRTILQLSPISRKEFSKYSTYPAIVKPFIRWQRELVARGSRRMARTFNFVIKRLRINPRGGIAIAIIGADGSGKTTVTTDLLKTFSEKLDVLRIYFGRGDGRASFERKLLYLLKRKYVKKVQVEESGTQSKSKSFLRTLYRCMQAMLVANEKRQNLKKMLKARQKGMLVICDRFPQNQIMGYNDGPLLEAYSTSKNFVLRWFAKKEASIYDRFESSSPDLVIKLIAEPEIVEKRKPGETSLENLKLKVDGIKALKFKPPCKVVTIDASIPLEEVLRSVREAIWQSIP